MSEEEYNQIWAELESLRTAKLNKYIDRLQKLLVAMYEEEEDNG